MGAQGASLRESFLTDFTFIRPFPCMSSSMLNQILPRTKCFPAKFTDLRLLTSVYSNMNLHILSSDQFTANLTSHLTFSSMRPQMFLITVTVESLEPTNLASVLPSILRLTVNLHVTSQINSITERLVTNLTNAWFIITMHAHVRFQRCL